MGHYRHCEGKAGSFLGGFFSGPLEQGVIRGTLISGYGLIELRASGHGRLVQELSDWQRLSFYAIIMLYLPEETFGLSHILPKMNAVRPTFGARDVSTSGPNEP